MRLNMTQATLSRQIQSLERVLKVELFKRANRTVRLTTAGQVFLPEAKRILAMMESATNWTRRAWQGEAGVIGRQQIGAVAQAHGLQQLAGVGYGIPPQLAPAGSGRR